jgi:Phage tail lysozyme
MANLRFNILGDSAQATSSFQRFADAVNNVSDSILRNDAAMAGNADAIDAVKDSVDDLVGRLAALDAELAKQRELAMSVDDKQATAALARLQVQASNLQRTLENQNIDLRGVASAEARLLTLDATADRLKENLAKANADDTAAGGFAGFLAGLTTTTTGGGGGWWGGLGAQIPLFGGMGAFGIMRTVAGWHLLADAIIEVGAELIPATIAVTAFAAAAEPAADDIYQHMSHVSAVVLATGKNLYPLTGGFTSLAKAVQPQVYSAFGDALTVMGQKAGAAKELVTGVGYQLDMLAARATNAIDSGAGSVFLHNAISDVGTLGDIVGNIFGTIGNLLHSMPGYANDLFHILDDVTRDLEDITSSGVVQGIIKIGLYFHGAALYVGLFTTGLIALYRSAIMPAVGGLASLATKFHFAGQGAVDVAQAFGVSGGALAKIQGNITSTGDAAAESGAKLEGAGSSAKKMAEGFGYSVPLLGKTSQGLGDVADTAEESAARTDFFARNMRVAAGDTGLLAGAAGVLDSIPVAGWAIAGAAAIGGLVVVLSMAKSATRAWEDELTGGIDAQKTFLGVIDYTTGAMNQANHQMADTPRASAVATASLRNMGDAVTSTWRAASTEGKYASDTLTLEDYRVQELAERFGSANLALGAFNLLHIKAGDIATASAGKWREDMTAVAGLTKAYTAMGYSAGQAGQDVRVLDYESSDQYQNVTQLNQAWDTWATTVTGGQSALDTWGLAMDGLPRRLKDAAAAFGGISKSDLTFNQNLENTLPQLETMQDQLRLAGVSGGEYTQAIKDMVTEYLPYAKGNDLLIGQLRSLSDDVIPSNVRNYQELVKWTGASSDSAGQLHDAERGLKSIMGDVTTQIEGMTQATQTQITFLGSEAEDATAKYIAQNVDLQQKLNAVAKAQEDGTTNTKAYKTALDAAGVSIVKVAGYEDQNRQQTIRMIEEYLKVPKKIATDIYAYAKGQDSVSYSYNSPGLPGSLSAHVHGAGGSAAGEYIRQGTHATADDVLRRVSRGELVVPAHMVDAGMVDHLRGKIPGFAAGGYIDPQGVSTGKWENSFAAKMAKDFTQAMTEASAALPAPGGSATPGLATIAKYLMAHNATKAAAAGIAGTIAGESGGDPESVGSGGAGLLGWTPPSAAFPYQPIVTGNAARDMAVQLVDMLAWIDSHGGMGRLNAAGSPMAAAWLFSADYERPAVTGSDIRPSVVEQLYSEGYKKGTWFVPADMNTRIHRGEMVLDEPIADAVRDNLSGGSGGAASKRAMVHVENMHVNDRTDIELTAKRLSFLVTGGGL